MWKKCSLFEQEKTPYFQGVFVLNFSWGGRRKFDHFSWGQDATVSLVIFFFLLGNLVEICTMRRSFSSLIFIFVDENSPKLIPMKLVVSRKIKW